MNNEDSYMAASGMIQAVQDQMVQVRDFMTDPSVLYRPSLSIDGDHWCALYGDDLQNGVAGFGKSPWEAMANFNKEWVKRLE